MVGFTPGPWQWLQKCGTLAVRGKKGVCVIHYGGAKDGPHHETARANARLIASAPDLLEALERTRQLVADCAPSGFTDEAAVMALYENNAALTAAISRAHGAEQGRAGE
jgi:hypothetical protein